MQNETIARVHRFRDSVALDVGTGETVYLSAELASRLAETLQGYATDVETVNFTDSQLGTVLLTIPEE